MADHLMRQLALTLGTSLFLFACGSAPSNQRGELSSSPAEDASLNRELIGDDADTLAKVLTDSGVKDSTGLLGAINLSAERILCATYVLIDGAPDCTIEFDQQKLKIPTEAARSLYALMLKYETFTPGPQGVNKLWVHRVSCVQMNYPHHSTPMCVLTVGP